MTEGSSGGFHVTGRVYRYNQATQFKSKSQSGASSSSLPSSSSSAGVKTTMTKKRGGKLVEGSSATGKDRSGEVSAEEGETLYTIAGRYDVRVTVTDVKTGETAVLYDAAEAAANEAVGVARSTLFHLPVRLVLILVSILHRGKYIIKSSRAGTSLLNYSLPAI